MRLLRVNKLYSGFYVSQARCPFWSSLLCVWIMARHVCWFSRKQWLPRQPNMLLYSDVFKTEKTVPQLITLPILVKVLQQADDIDGQRRPLLHTMSPGLVVSWFCTPSTPPAPTVWTVSCCPEVVEVLSVV